jgi:hypothetical protein
MNINIKHIYGEVFQMTVFEQDSSASFYFDQKVAQKIAFDATTALQEYDEAEVGKQMEAEKYMEGS